MKHKTTYWWLGLGLCAAVALAGCVSLGGYRQAKARMLYLEYERINGPMQATDTAQTANEAQ